MEPNSTRGGKRAGSGRKKKPPDETKKVRVSVYLTPEHYNLTAGLVTRL